MTDRGSTWDKGGITLGYYQSSDAGYRLFRLILINTQRWLLNTCLPYCQPVSGISGRRHLRSADRGHLDFPRVKLASYGGRSFAYTGPSNWNSLPAHLRDNSLSLSSFKRHLKTFLFSFYYRLAHAARLGFFLQKRAITNSLLLLMFMLSVSSSTAVFLQQ